MHTTRALAFATAATTIGLAAACAPGPRPVPTVTAATMPTLVTSPTTIATPGTKPITGEDLRAKIGRLTRKVPAAVITTAPSLAGPTDADVEQYLTTVIHDVDAYWTTTLGAAGLSNPKVSYRWVAHGQTVSSPCGVRTASSAAYCPADRTITIGVDAARKAAAGQLRADGTGIGHPSGAFSIAYVVAHEYAHKVQHQLAGAAMATLTNPGLELHADCWAGTWASSAYRAGEVSDDGLLQAVETANLGGDLDVESSDHHGTPLERQHALVQGMRAGAPLACTPLLGA